MLLGSGLADFFDISTGDFLTILTKTRDGAYEALDLPIIGILGTGNPLIDRSSFLIPLGTAQQMLDLEGEATEISVRFNALARESATLRNLRSVVGDLNGVEIKGWREVEEDFMALVEMKRTAQGVFLSIFVIMAIVGIANTIVMATYERTREIGTLMAMGFRGAGIRRLFLTEGALTGFIGGAIGMVFSVLLIGYFASTGIDISALYGDMDIGYPVKDMIYPSMNPVLFFVSWFLTGVLAALASLYPAYRASILQPVNALRHA
jgi:ABC-type lipoprotein release transport system permease subunit